MSTPETLTAHLQSLSTAVSFTAATQHPFLVAAGTGKLSKELLSLYLFQDRLYAEAYPRFGGQLLAAVPFSSLDALKSPEEQLNQRIVRVLVYSLQNCMRESQSFFVEVSEKFGLDLEGWRERKATRDYIDAMVATVARGGLAEGLVFIWANERVRLFMVLWIVRSDTPLTFRYTLTHGVTSSPSSRSPPNHHPLPRLFAFSWTTGSTKSL